MAGMDRLSFGGLAMLFGNSTYMGRDGFLKRLKALNTA